MFVGKGSMFPWPSRSRVTRWVPQRCRYHWRCVLKDTLVWGGASRMVQILGLTPAVLFGISAALSLNSEQGLILTGRHLTGKNKFICLLGLCHEQNSKSCIAFIVGFLNTPFPQKLKRSVWNAILYFKLNTEQLSTVSTYIVSPLNYVSFDTLLIAVVTGRHRSPDCWGCLCRTTLGHSQAAGGLCFSGSLGHKFW